MAFPARLGDYTVLRPLGEGGMARALLATSPTGRQVVLKVPLEQSAQMRLRLRDEARAGQRLRHPHIVETLDFFVDHDRAVLVLEYIEGCALRDLRQLGGAPNPLPPIAVAWLGRTIAAALGAIHAAVDEHGAPLRMLHRDVTPANILIANDGTPRLIDLGIARSAETEAERTATGHVKGTLRYLAPELWQGASHTPMTDLWSLGVTLLEASLGRVMVSGDALAVMRFLTTGKYRELRPGEALDPDLADAIFTLVTDDASRLRSAAAASNVFGRIEEQLRNKHPRSVGGQQCLRAWVPWARPQGDDDGDAANDLSQQSDGRPAVSGDQHTATFSAVLSAPGDVLPIGAPTVQMPQWHPPEPRVANWDDDDEDEPVTLERAPRPQPLVNVDTVPMSLNDIRSRLVSRRGSTEK